MLLKSKDFRDLNQPGLAGLARLNNIFKKSFTFVHHIVHFTKCIFVQLKYGI